MRAILHILTRPEDVWAGEIIARQKTNAESNVEVVDLNAGPPDYQAVVRKVFQADSVQVW
jgi:hypothetical protein